MICLYHTAICAKIKDDCAENSKIVQIFDARGLTFRPEAVFGRGAAKVDPRRPDQKSAPSRRNRFDHESTKNPSATAANIVSAPHSITGNFKRWKNCAPNHGPTA